MTSSTIRSTRVARVLVCLLASSCIAACGRTDSRPETARVNGTVTYEGQPLTTGRVSFVKRTNAGGSYSRPAVGVIDERGRYEMTTFTEGDGVVPGEYVVVVESLGAELDPEDFAKGLERESLIPERFASVETSGLTIVIDGDLEHDIVLTDEE